jgi:hypothetical protein
MKVLAIVKNPIFLGVTLGVAAVGTGVFFIVKHVKKGKKVEVVEDAKQEAAQ